MKFTSKALAALAVFTASANARVADGHPIEKVIAMLGGLSEKAKAEGLAEQNQFDKFSHWCAVSTKTLSKAITEEKEQIEVLTSQISSEEKQIEDLNTNIAKLEKEIEEMAASQMASEEARKKGRELYAQVGADLQATVDAVKEALKGVEASMAPASLAQLLAKPQLRKALALASFEADEKKAAVASSLLQQITSGGQPAPAPRPDLLAAGDDAAHVQPYEAKSGGVVELLKGLVTQFEDEYSAATKEETNAENAFALETQARTAASDAATKSKDEKTGILGEVMQTLNSHKGELKETQADLAADEQSLGETTSACDVKTQEWQTRSETRAKEIEAMGIAQEILAKATGVRTEAPSNPGPPASPVEASAPAFLQISDPRQRAITLLKQKARETHSKALLRMAQELAMHASDPFAVVNNNIEKMIFHLQAEQTDEDNHKNWCDQELSKTNTSKVNKEEKIAELAMKIDSATAKVQDLTTHIKEANEMLAQITMFVGEATEIREIGKKENAEAVEESQQAQTAIADATAVLEAFYKESGMVTKESYEFVQAPVELGKNPSTWDSGYSGVADPTAQPAGIIAVLEQVASDFASMEAETRAQEAEDQHLFEEQIKANEIEKADRTQEVEMKTAEKKRTLDSLESLKTTKKHVSNELEAVNQYLKDLEPACVTGDSSYDERRAARDAEIAALKEAEQILANAFAEKPSGSFLAIKKHMA